MANDPSNPGDVLNDLVSHLDDASWRLNTAALSAQGIVRRELNQLADACGDLSIELTQTQLSCGLVTARRFEAAYERNCGLIGRAANPLALLFDCMRALSTTLCAYESAARHELPSCCDAVLIRHREQLETARVGVHALTAKLPPATYPWVSASSRG